MAQQAKVYLDDQGNPVNKTYLDDQGNPIETPNIQTPIGEVGAKPEQLAQEVLINKPASVIGQGFNWLTSGVFPEATEQQRAANPWTTGVQDFFNPSPLEIGAGIATGGLGYLGLRALRGGKKATGVLQRLENIPMQESTPLNNQLKGFGDIPNPKKPLRDYQGGFNPNTGPFKSPKAPLTPSMGDFDEPIDLLTARMRSGIPSLPIDDASLRAQIESDGLIYKLGEITKGAKATGDLGPVFRQGIAYSGRPAWFRALRQQFVSYASEGGHQKYLDNIKKDRLMQDPSNEGLSWVERMGLDVGAKEETLAGINRIEKVPVVGRAARASNRAFNDSMSELRLGIANVLYDNYDRLYKSMKKTAKTAKELEEAEMFNPENPLVGKKIADSVNTGSGRGSLKVGSKFLGEMNLDPIAKELNLFAFSPRLLSSRIRTIARTMTPVGYMRTDPVQRIENLKQLLSIAGAVTTSATMYKMLGAETGTEPTSSDFGKSRFGNITMDNTGGLGRLPTLEERIRTNTVTTPRGRKYKLGENPVVGDAMDIVENFGEGLASPAASMVMNLIRRADYLGKPLNFTSTNPFENTAVKDLMMPMIYQDLYEIMKEDPSYIPLIFPAALGQSVNVYSK